MSEFLPYAILLCSCALVLLYAARVSADYRAAARKIERLQAMSPYAHLLGRVIEARVYEASDWERYVVVAVSWQGAVCVRREDAQHLAGRWIPKDKAPYRIREVRR